MVVSIGSNEWSSTGACGAGSGPLEGGCDAPATRAPAASEGKRKESGMKLMTCACGQSFTLAAIPQRPFVACPRCGRRLPVHCDPSEFMDRCPRCGRFLERDILAIHAAGCTGESEFAPETADRRHL